MPHEPQPDDRQCAVVDRLVDGQAVLLVGDGEEEHVVSADTLPAGAVEGSVLIVSVDDDGIEIVGLDAHGTDEQHEQMRERLDRLRARSRRFGGDR